MDEQRFTDSLAALARRFAPIIFFDADEPFLPDCAGVTVFHASGASPSFPRYVAVEAPAVLAVEYALWWDWDIQHLYELEHVWVFADGQGAIVHVETSQHGAAGEASAALMDGRPVLYAEPGKHALVGDHCTLLARRAGTEHACRQGAGSGGVWVTPLYRGRITKSPVDDQLVRTSLRRHAFAPRWEWSQRVDVADLDLLPWPVLDRMIPGRVAARVAELDQNIPDSARAVWHIGHRGAGVHAPGNTLAGIRTAARLGAHLVELDVRTSADGIPVLSHDASISVGAQKMSIGALSAAELEESDQDPEQAIPTLRRALDVCRELGLGAYLDVKEPAAVEALLGELARGDLRRRCITASSDPTIVASMTDRAPHIPSAILFGGYEVDPVALARGCGASYVHPCWERHPEPHTLLTPEWLSQVREAGLGLICWHEERPAVLRELLKLGVMGICTDRLDLLAELDPIMLLK